MSLNPSVTQNTLRREEEEFHLLSLKRLVLLSCGLALVAGACRPDEPTQPTGQIEAAATAPTAQAAANSWTIKAKMPTGRWWLTGRVINNAAGQPILYAVGGYNSGGSSGVVEAYNFATDTWTSRAPLPERLASTNGMGVIKGKLYISGGEFFNTSQQEIPSVVPNVYVYDPAHNSWARKAESGIRPSHPAPRHMSGAWLAQSTESSM